MLRDIDSDCNFVIVLFMFIILAILRDINNDASVILI